MVNQFVITIKNQSGSPQDYSLFNEKPNVNGKVQKDIYSNVFCSFSTAKNDTSQVSISTQYKAVVGTHKGENGDAVKVKVGQTRNVNLGVVNDDGTVKNGTTLEFTRASNGAPTFADNELPSAGFANAFAIKSPVNQGWTKIDAVNGNWVIGLGLDSSEGHGPAATFVPEPGATYQIQPSNTFYIVPAMYEKGVVMDVAKIGDTLAIDFTKIPSGKVTIVHGKEGGLTIQKATGS